MTGQQDGNRRAGRKIVLRGVHVVASRVNISYPLMYLSQEPQNAIKAHSQTSARVI